MTAKDKDSRDFKGPLEFTEAEVKSLRVILVTPSLHVPDGVSLTVRKIHQRVTQLGGKLKIITSEIGERVLKDDPIFEDVIFHKSLHMPYDRKDDYATPMMLNKSLKKKILDFKANVFHFTSPDTLAFSISEWSRKNRFPLIATWHSNIPDYLDHTGNFQKHTFKPFLSFIFRTLYSYALFTYVPQEKLLLKLENQGYQRLRVWGRGVDTKMFTPAKRSEKLRRELKATKDTLVVLWVSRCVKEKRPDIFIEVMKRLQTSHPKVIAWLVGRGENFDAMAALPNVLPLGWKEKSQLAELYASSDVLFFPSGVETFGNVTLEGMSSGICVIGDRECSSHLIENGVTGFTCSQEYVNGKSPFDQYYEAVVKLAEDKQLRENCGKQARAVAETWSLEKVLDEMVAHYCEAKRLGDNNQVPAMKFNNKQRLIRILYEILDKGGSTLVTILGGFAFYWQDFGKVSALLGLASVVGVGFLYKQFST